MLRDICEHARRTCERIAPDDNPFDLRLGFKSDSGLTWSIRLSDLKRSFLASPEKAKALRSLFGTVKGRAELAQNLSDGALPAVLGD